MKIIQIAVDAEGTLHALTDTGEVLCRKDSKGPFKTTLYTWEPLPTSCGYSYAQRVANEIMNYCTRPEKACAVMKSNALGEVVEFDGGFTITSQGHVVTVEFVLGDLVVTDSESEPVRLTVKGNRYVRA